MNRTQHILLQALIQGLQAFTAYPGVQLPINVEAALHSMLGAATLVLAWTGYGYAVDGTPLTKLGTKLDPRPGRGPVEPVTKLKGDGDGV